MEGFKEIWESLPPWIWSKIMIIIGLIINIIRIPMNTQTQTLKKTQTRRNDIFSDMIEIVFNSL